MSKNNRFIKIIVPVLLLCAVIGIWAIKNSKKDINPAGTENSHFALHVTEKIDIEKLKSYGLPIIIDFGADSCIPCKPGRYLTLYHLHMQLARILNVVLGEHFLQEF